MSTAKQQVITSPITARARIAADLERGAHASRAARAAAWLWGAVAARSLDRPLCLPSHARVRVIGVGGPTLGGSYKTGTAVAVAQALAARGLAAALVGHAYRAKPGRPRVVTGSDAVEEVGDDALWAARALAGVGVPVIVAPSRQAALDHAVERAAWVVVDGLLQSAPARLHRSLLVTDAVHPWGSGLCPPAGDLRARQRDLLAATDARLVVVDDVLPGDGAHAHAHALALAPAHAGTDSAVGEARRYLVRASLRWATNADGGRVALSALASELVGVVVATARPDRIVRSLALRGVVPRVTLRFPDHARPTTRALERAVSGQQWGASGAPRVWLTTAKCATKLPPRIANAPVLVLAHELTLGPDLISWLCSECASPAFSGATAVVDCAPCEPPAGK